MGGKDAQHYVAVLVLETFVGPRPRPGYAVRYKDGNASNCRLENLEWSLNSANAVVPIKEFVTAWQTSRTVKEVMEKTGLTFSNVTARASNLKGRGVPLKKLERTTVSYDEIAEFAKGLLENE